MNHIPGPHARSSPVHPQAPGGAGRSAADPQAPIAPLVVSTQAVPARLQFDAWRAQCVPYLDTDGPSQPKASGFAATGSALPFGQFMLYGATLPPYDYRRTAARIRRDSLDHWIVAICRRGTQRQRSGDASFTMQPGVPYILTMARAFEAERAGAQIDWLSLFIARDAVPELDQALAACLNRPLDTPQGRMLAGFMESLQSGVGALRGGDLPRLGTATRAMLALAVAPSADTAAEATPQIEMLQLARLRRLIRERLGSATLGPARLSGLAGMSRSRLYRLFEPLGGVARHIQRERLRQAHRMLTDPRETRRIAEIAEAVGLFEPSTFSRAFRQEFGITPGEARGAALSGEPLPRLKPGASKDVLGLLHDL